MDNISREKRHKIMASIHSRDTKPEVLLRKTLWHKGIRYRKNYKMLPGTPDIAITRCHVAIFVDGDFWHGRDLAKTEQRLGTNKQFWVKKLENNVQRDLYINEQLTELGWVVLRFWESDIESGLENIISVIEKYVPYLKAR